VRCVPAPDEKCAAKMFLVKEKEGGGKAGVFERSGRT